MLFELKAFRCFVPIEDVISKFKELVSALDLETDKVLTDFLLYFEATWLYNEGGVKDERLISLSGMQCGKQWKACPNDHFHKRLK